MQDTRALKNPRNLSSWRAWNQKALWRSGFFAMTVGVFPLLTVALAVACALFKPDLRYVGVSGILTAFGVYLAVALGLMAFAVLRLNAWKQANPWTPPS